MNLTQIPSLFQMTGSVRAVTTVIKKGIRRNTEIMSCFLFKQWICEMCQSFIGNIFSLVPDRSWGYEAAAVLPLSGCQTQFDIFLTIIYIYILKKPTSANSSRFWRENNSRKINSYRQEQECWNPADFKQITWTIICLTCMSHCSDHSSCTVAIINYFSSPWKFMLTVHLLQLVFPGITISHKKSKRWLFGAFTCKRRKNGNIKRLSIFHISLHLIHLFILG